MSITVQPSDPAQAILTVGSPVVLRQQSDPAQAIFSNPSFGPWTLPSVPYLLAFAIVWSPELDLFVVGGNVAGQSKFVTSSDGENWTFRDVADNSNAVICLAWSAALGIFVASGNKPMTSSDGINWSTGAYPAAFSIKGLAWSPALALFIAAGINFGGSQMGILSSPDGVNWTDRSPLTSDDYGQAICWNPELGLFVIAGANSAILTSADGSNWVQRLPAINNGGLNDVCWSAALGIFLAIGYDFDAQILFSITSTDGSNWTQHDLPVLATPLDALWSGVAWSEDLGLFCIVGDGTDQVATSEDGLAWTVQSLPASNHWLRIAWSQALAKFAACANSDDGLNYITIS